MAGLPGAGPLFPGFPTSSSPTVTPLPTTTSQPGLIPGLPSGIPGLPTPIFPTSPFDPNPLPGNPFDPFDPSSSTTTTTTTTTTTSSTPTVIPLPPPTTTTAVTPPPVVTVTSVVPPPAVVTPTQVPTQEAANASPSFLHNKPLMTGVFTVLGIAIAILIVGCATIFIRRRRARQVDNEIAEAGRMPWRREDINEAPPFTEAGFAARGYSFSDSDPGGEKAQYGGGYAPSAAAAYAPPSSYNGGNYSYSTPSSGPAPPNNAPRYPNAGPYGPSGGGNGGYDAYGPAVPQMIATDAYSGMAQPASYGGAGAGGEYYPSYPPMGPTSEDYHPISPGRARSVAPTESSGTTTLASSSNASYGLPPNTRIAQSQQRGDVPLPLVAGVRRYSQAVHKQFTELGQSPPLSPLDRELPAAPPRRQESVGSLREMDYGATRADLKVVNG